MTLKKNEYENFRVPEKEKMYTVKTILTESVIGKTSYMGIFSIVQNKTKEHDNLQSRRKNNIDYKRTMVKIRLR